MNIQQRAATFRERLRRGDRLLGSWVLTPHPAVVEILGATALDCLCLDVEHAPFDRGDVDAALLAARATDMPVLVRLGDAAFAGMQNALDLGASGILVPHVASAAAAQAIATACRYGAQGRGYSGTTRAAGFGARAMREHVAAANAQVTLIAMIEDAAALTDLDGIAAVDEIDAIFIERMDLTLSLGAPTPDDPIVVAAVEQICAAARRHGRPLGMYTPRVEEVHQWSAAGASLFLLESDQLWLKQGAQALREAFGDG